METTRQGVEIKALRERMRARGVSVGRLAREADLYENDTWRFLAGARMGPVRRAHLDAAARRLGVGEGEDDSE